MGKLPTLLAYTKGIEATECKILNELNSEIVTNTGVQSFDKEDSKTDQANIITSEKIYLKDNEDTLHTEYRITFTGVDISPTKCNDLNVLSKLDQFVSTIIGIEEIRKIYAEGLLFQILTGVFSERNRTMSSEIKVEITAYINKNNQLEEKIFNFDLNCRELPVHYFKQDFTKTYEFKKNDLLKFNELSNLIADYLGKSKNDPDLLTLNIKHGFKLVKGSIVYPNQLFIEGSFFQIIKKRGYAFSNSGAKTVKLFYKTLSDYEHFGYSPETILNSLRRFDVWYSNPQYVGPIPFEPQGNVSKYNKNFRNKDNIYKLLEKAINLDIINEDTLIDNFSKEEILFIFAMILRGGLFNSESKKNK